MLTLAACAYGLALATPALADGVGPDFPNSVLHISVKGSGPDLAVTATGSNAELYVGAEPAGTIFELYGYLVEPGGPPCSATQTGELDIENYPIVTEVTSINDFSEGTSGSFTLHFEAAAPIGYSGPLTVCAYSVNAYDTAAWATGSAAVKAPAPASTTPKGSGPGGGGTKPGVGKQPGAGAGSHRPAVIARPRVTRRGHKLVCSRGRWSGKPTAYQYTWVVTREAGSPSLTSKLAITRKMHGRQAECQVTASNSKGRATATSPPVNIK